MAEETQVQETAEFDWDSLSKDVYTQEERTELSDKYAITLNSFGNFVTASS